MCFSAIVSFIGTVTVGFIELRTKIFRSGKSVAHAEVRLLPNGEVLAVLLAIFGRSRESTFLDEFHHLFIVNLKIRPYFPIMRLLRQTVTMFL